MISIDEPTEEFDKANKKYISYSIKCRNIETCRRRFSDFEWLHKMLLIENHGIILPCLPDKKVFGNFDPNFIEVRQRSLNRYLIILELREDLQNSDTFKMFKTSSFDEFIQFKLDSVNKEKEYMKMLSNCKYRLLEENIPINQAIENIRLFTIKFDKQLRKFIRQVQAIINKYNEVSLLLNNFYGTIPDEVNHLAVAQSMNRNMSSVVDELTICNSKHVILVVEPLQDYLRSIKSVSYALNEIQKYIRLYVSSCHETHDIEKKIKKLQKNEKLQSEVEIQQHLLEVSKEKVIQCQNQLDEIVNRVMNEFSNYQDYLCKDFDNIIDKFVQNEINSHDQMSLHWNRLIDSNLSKNFKKLLDLPYDFVCPISGDIMEDPVLAEDGCFYDKNSIERWFNRNAENSAISPMINKPICKNLYKSLLMTRLVKDYKN